MRGLLAGWVWCRSDSDARREDDAAGAEPGGPRRRQVQRATNDAHGGCGLRRGRICPRHEQVVITPPGRQCARDAWLPVADRRPRGEIEVFEGQQLASRRLQSLELGPPLLRLVLLLL